MFFAKEDSNLKKRITIQSLSNVISGSKDNRRIVKVGCFIRWPSSCVIAMKD